MIHSSNPGSSTPSGLHSADSFRSPVRWDAVNSEAYAELPHDEASLVIAGDVRSGTKAVISYRNPGALTGDVVLDIIVVDKATGTETTTSTTLTISPNQLIVDASITLGTPVTALAELRISRDYADAADTLASYLNLLTAGVA